MTEIAILYTRPDCEYSGALRDELDAAGRSYREIDVSIHTEAIKDLLKYTDGDRITPVLVEGDQVSVGFRGIG